MQIPRCESSQSTEPIAFCQNQVDRLRRLKSTKSIESAKNWCESIAIDDSIDFGGLTYKSVIYITHTVADHLCYVKRR